MLRQEVYADNAEPGANAAQIPTTPAHPTPSPSRTSRSSCCTRRTGNRHAVFFAHSCEAITYHYERNPDDPRIGHTLTLEVDRVRQRTEVTLRSVITRADIPDPRLAETTKKLPTYTG